MQVSEFCSKGCTARSKPLLALGQLNGESLLVQSGATLLPEPAGKGGEGTGREQDCQYLLLGGCQDEGALISVEGSAVPNHSRHLSGKNRAASRQSQEQRLWGSWARFSSLGNVGASCTELCWAPVRVSVSGCVGFSFILGCSFALD